MYELYDKEDGESIKLLDTKKINGIIFKKGDIIYMSKEKASWFVEALKIAEKIKKEDL